MADENEEMEEQYDEQYDEQDEPENHQANKDYSMKLDEFRMNQDFPMNDNDGFRNGPPHHHSPHGPPGRGGHGGHGGHGPPGPGGPMNRFHGPPGHGPGGPGPRGPGGPFGGPMRGRGGFGPRGPGGPRYLNKIMTFRKKNINFVIFNCLDYDMKPSLYSISCRTRCAI